MMPIEQVKDEPRRTASAPRQMIKLEFWLDRRDIESLGALLALTQDELDLLAITQ